MGDFVSRFVSIVSAMADRQVPYVHMGRTWHAVDCVGVVVLALQEMGVDIGDERSYPALASNGSLVREFGRRFALAGVSADETVAGDVMLLWWDRKTREPQHVAVCVGDGEIVHSYARVKRVVRSHLGLWSKRVTHVYRFHPRMVEPWQR